MTPIGLARKIAKLRKQAKITAEFERELTSLGAWNPKREIKKYSSQKEHWHKWLSQYKGPGYYGRKDHEVTAAETVYNRIGCPPMLLWLAETAGAPKRQIRVAMQSALSVAPSYARQCAAIRRAIPWEVIEFRLRKH